jgi:hypothetical protein
MRAPFERSKKDEDVIQKEPLLNYLKAKIDQFFLVDIENHMTLNSKVDSNKKLKWIELGISGKPMKKHKDQIEIALL